MLPFIPGISLYSLTALQITRAGQAAWRGAMSGPEGL